MTSDKHPIRNGIIATVLGGLLLTGILKLFGVVGTVLRFTFSTIRNIPGILTTRLAIPVWLLALILSFAVILAFRRIRTTLMDLVDESSTTPVPYTAAEPEPAVQEQPELQLDELQAKIMAIYAVQDGGNFAQQQLSKRCETNMLRTSKAIDGLVALGLLGEAHDYIYGISYVLTRGGRDFLIDKGAV